MIKLSQNLSNQTVSSKVPQFESLQMKFAWQNFTRFRYFIFTSFWAYKIYYVYGFMLLVFVILAIVTVCVTIVCTYFLLNAEDYRWWVVYLESCVRDAILSK